MIHGGTGVAGIPDVDVPVPNPADGLNEDSVFDGFANFVTEHYRVVSVGIIMLGLMMMWKRPVWRGILIGVLLLSGVLFFATA